MIGSSGRPGMRVLDYLMDRADYPVHVSALSDGLGLELAQVINAAALLANNERVPVVRVKKGTYKFVSPGVILDDRESPITELPTAGNQYVPHEEPIPKPIAIGRTQNGKYVVTLDNGATILGDLI